MIAPRTLALLCLVTAVMAGEPLLRMPRTTSGAPHFSFLLHQPEGPAPAAGWPLVLSLHGFSARGTDLARLETQGLPRAIREGLRPGMVVVAPQLTGLTWRDDQLDAFLRWVVARHPVDASRIYATGVSLGGAGLWNLVARRPGWFAAFAPVAGTAAVDIADACRATPVWAFHGTEDAQVPIADQRAAIAAHAALSGEARLTEFPGAGHHDFAREVFVAHDLIGWFATRQRAEASIPPGKRTYLEPLPLAAPVARWGGALALPEQATLLGWIDAISARPHRRPGSDHGRRTETWLVDRLREFGLDVSAQEVPVNRWEPSRWSLTLGGGEIPSHPVMYTPFTGPGGLSAPLVAVGQGRASDFARVDVAGRIVVIDAAIAPTTRVDTASALFVQDPAGRYARPVRHVAYPRNYLSDFADNALLRGLNAVTRAADAGAVGFVMVLDGHAPAVASLGFPYDGLLERIPGWYVPSRHGAALRKAAAVGAALAGRSEGIAARGTMRNVSAIVPGRNPRAVIVASHHDAPGPGVIEDATGTAAVLALASAWSQVPAEQRPCTVAFVLASGHFSRGEGAYRFAAAHPRLLGDARAVLELEHLAGREVEADAAGNWRVLSTRQPSNLYVSRHPEMAALARAALEAEPQPPVTVEFPFLDLPLTDAAGYVTFTREAGSGGRAGLPYISWISAPPYLVDEHDTRDKLDVVAYLSAVRASAELFRRLVALPDGFNQ